MATLSLIKRPIEGELNDYRNAFHATLEHPDGLLGSALAHIRNRQGKLMRPMLVLLCAKAAGGVNDGVTRAAVTLELLHTASLVHDDIVDESDERRGQPSVNATYDNKVAVLVGDYLLSTALEQAAATGSTRVVASIARLGKSLSEGEVFQLSNIHNETATEEAYFRIIHQKTAALFATCAELGALMAGADDATVTRHRELGEIIGICFQIRDDIFDYYDEGNIGKPTGNDLREGKLTLPLIHALHTQASNNMEALSQRVKSGQATDEDIARLVDFAKTAGGIDYAEQVMADYARQGYALARELAGNTPVGEALAEYISYVVERDK